jgi:hypothetical protein
MALGIVALQKRIATVPGATVELKSCLGLFVPCAHSCSGSGVRGSGILYAGVLRGCANKKGPNLAIEAFLALLLKFKQSKPYCDDDG